MLFNFCSIGSIHGAKITFYYLNNKGFVSFFLKKCTLEQFFNLRCTTARIATLPKRERTPLCTFQNNFYDIPWSIGNFLYLCQQN